jgi:RNA polymerase sigma factor (sigma-70 family)
MAMIDVAALYRQHGAMVFRRARRLLADEEAARDLVHDVFITLHERQDELQDTGMVSWLYVVVTNRCLKRMRTAATRARIVGSIDHVRHAPARGEAVVAIRRVLATLPDELAAVAVYRFVDEMTHAEIATMMGCSRRHVGDLLVRFEHAMATTRGAL